MWTGLRTSHLHPASEPLWRLGVRECGFAAPQCGEGSASLAWHSWILEAVPPEPTSVGGAASIEIISLSVRHSLTALGKGQSLLRELVCGVGYQARSRSTAQANK